MWFDRRRWGTTPDHRARTILPESWAPDLHPRVPARQAFAKALPLLTLVFVLEILNALNFDFGFWTNIGFLAGGIGISLGIIGALNVARGQPFFSVPRRVGPAEMLVFVLVPSLLPLLFGGQVTSAVVTLIGNTLLLGLVYLVFGFGAVSILEWAVRRFVSLFAASLSVLVRALSLLLFFLLVIFFSTETWQIWTFAAGAEVRRGGRVCSSSSGGRLPLVAASRRRSRSGTRG